MKVTRDFADVQAAVVAEGTTLLLLDVDNTLLTCDGPGCEHWEKAMTAELLRLGCEQKDAWRVACWLWSSLHKAGVRMSLCEAETAALVSTFKQHAQVNCSVCTMFIIQTALTSTRPTRLCQVVGLTARHPNLCHATSRDLKALESTMAHRPRAWEPRPNIYVAEATPH